MRETRAAHFSLSSFFFAFAPGLRGLIVTTAASLGENTGLLHFSVKLFQCNLKGTIGVYNYLTHPDYQRDLPAPVDWVLRG